MFSTETLTHPKVIQLLKSGGVGVIPTDTVYGLVCRAADQDAVKKLYALKHRKLKPGTVIAANIDQLANLGIKKRYLKAVEQYWPGAISIEIPHSVAYLHQGTGRQAFRIPNDAEVISLLEQVGPLQTTSANHPDAPTATTLTEAEEYFGNLVDFYVDGGNMDSRPPSTIIRIVDDAIEIIREGAVKINENGRIEK